MQSYLDEVIRPRLRPLKAEVVAPEAVLTYLDGLREAFTRTDSMSATSGCLLINTATAPVVHDGEVARVVADYRDELRAAIGRGVAAYLGAAAPEEQERLADAVTGLSIAAFALVRIARPKPTARSSPLGACSPRHVTRRRATADARRRRGEAIDTEQALGAFVPPG